MAPRIPMHRPTPFWPDLQIIDDSLSLITAMPWRHSACAHDACRAGLRLLSVHGGPAPNSDKPRGGVRAAFGRQVGLDYSLLEEDAKCALLGAPSRRCTTLRVMGADYGDHARNLELAIFETARRLRGSAWAAGRFVITSSAAPGPVSDLLEIAAAKEIRLAAALPGGAPM